MAGPNIETSTLADTVTGGTFGVVIDGKTGPASVNGDLTVNGNLYVTGSSVETTTATLVEVATVGTNASFYPVFVSALSGNLTLGTDAGISYNPSTNVISATTFIGNVTGNTSGSAATVTTAAQPAITSVGTLSGLSVTATITGNISGSSATVTSAAQPAITSVGTLTALTVTGLAAAGNVSSTGTTSVGTLLGLGSYTKGALPTADDAGDVIYVTDSTSAAGQTGALCFSRAAGTASWIDVTTGVAVV